VSNNAYVYRNLVLMHSQHHIHYHGTDPTSSPPGCV
jgi:hypothetical protein